MSGCLPLKLQQVGKLQFNKEMLNTQTCLRDTHIETSEGGHIRVNMGDGMGGRTKVKVTGSPAITMGPENLIAMNVGMHPPLDKLEGQKEQSGLCGLPTLRLSPGLRAEKWCKGLQRSIAYQHQTKDSADMRICPPHIPAEKSSLIRAQRLKTSFPV